MKTLALAAALAAVLGTPAFAGLEDLKSDFAFVQSVRETVALYEAKDTLRETPECAILERKWFRPFSLVEAVKALQPCFDGVSRKSGLAVRLEPGVVQQATQEQGPVMGIVVVTGDAPVASQGMRDLSYSLGQRGNELLGHPVAIRRAGDLDAGRKSAAQDALDACMLTTVLHKIESGADFIRHYGACITRAEALKVKELRPSPGHQFGVLAVSSASDVVVESINGSVQVMAEAGPVRIMIMAYAETFSLPK